MVKNSITLALSMLFAICIGEVLVRFIVPQQLIAIRSDIWQPVEKFGWRHNSNVRATINSGEGRVSFVTDSNGYRINVDAQPVSSEDVRIIVLGDSFLEAQQVENRQSVSELIRESLDEQFGMQAKVDNTGVSGWNPNHYLLEATEALNARSYDLGLVFLYVANDIVYKQVSAFKPHSTQEKNFRMPQSFTWPQLVESIIFPFNEVMEAHSHLYVLFKNASQSLRIKLGLSHAYFPEIFLTEQAGYHGWEVTARIGNDIAAQFLAHDVPVAFILIPAAYQVHDSIFDNYSAAFDVSIADVDLLQPNRLLAQEFSKMGLQLHDPLIYLRESAGSNGPLYGSVDSHLNVQGHLALANYLQPLVAGLVEQSIGLEGKP